MSGLLLFIFGLTAWSFLPTNDLSLALTIFIPFALTGAMFALQMALLRTETRKIVLAMTDDGSCSCGHGGVTGVSNENRSVLG